MKYSIIVPVYNAEKTLHRCLDSVVKQPFTDYELLLINDGSSDGSSAICREYVQKYPQIHYMEGKNSGVSAARNLGLDWAQGEYILFLDSDDFVAENYFVCIDQALQAYNPDMLLFGAKGAGNSPCQWNTGNFFANTELQIASRISSALKAYLFSSLLSKVFKKKIIEQLFLRFDSNLSIGEDQAFIFSYAMGIHSLASIEDVLYNVDISDGSSLSRKKRPYLTQQLLAVNRKMDQAYRSVPHAKAAAECYEAALSWVVYRSAYSCFKELLKFDIPPKQRRREIRNICKLYRAERVKPRGLKCWLIALPVLSVWSMGIHWIIRQKS